MKKFFVVSALLAPLAFAGCTDRGETVVVQPPPSQSPPAVVVPDSAPRTYVVPESDEPRTYVVPESDGAVKVCPRGSVC